MTCDFLSVHEVLPVSLASPLIDQYGEGLIALRASILLGSGRTEPRIARPVESALR
jgi:hypothetical protein